jgi:hypothetical protein
MKNLTRREFLRQASGGATILGTGILAASEADRLLAQATACTPLSPACRRTAFCFLHSYEATGRYWRGLEKAGLLRPGNGVRLVHSPLGDDWRRFNAVARRGGPLDQLLQQRKCHFVVDRVVGGSPYHPYIFDAQLVEHYASLLGSNFLGGQVHETVCNVRNDWGRFAVADRRFARAPIAPDRLRSWFNWTSELRWLEYGTLDDYAGRVRPGSSHALWKEIERAARTQAARFHGHFSYCEGSGCGYCEGISRDCCERSAHGEHVWHIFYGFGAAYCLAQIGVDASHQAQFAIASLRGAAKAAGKPWGVFFAPWGPKGVTCFIGAKDQSWQAGESPADGRNGPSSALQRRVFFHAYLSGAHTLHEEWGAEGNLLDWNEGKISSYGKVTRDLLDFQEAHPDVGEPYTPIALVLDASVPPADGSPWGRLKQRLFEHADIDKAAAARPGSGKAEADCYAPCALPEIFDIVPSSAPSELWRAYQAVIPVGTAALPPGAKACPPEAVYDRLAGAVGQWSPLARSTHLPMQINYRRSDGAWIIGLYNPWGAERGDVGHVGSLLDDGCTIRDVLRPKFAVRSVRALHAWPGNSAVSRKGDDIHVVVGPGGTLVLEVK